MPALNSVHSQFGATLLADCCEAVALDDERRCASSKQTGRYRCAASAAPMPNSARRMQLFTVPKGQPKRAAMSLWLMPSS